MEAMNDVALLRIEAPAQNCNTQAYPTVLVQNNSTGAINSLHFRYFLEGEELYEQEYDWVGNLIPGALEEVELPPLAATIGEFSLVVEVTMANGEPDARHLLQSLHSFRW